ncbi:sugar transferase [Agromyces badenianii]|uniref:sugar transferase n=1 Tax=Agromyces badenianii TaxID=2080742 RepID=UPI000D5985A6|nr:sugar transferase [Agromyces badenianii]PWC05011.1 UDP-galactose phosphate transferase [Agromyces badenianii]
MSATRPYDRIKRVIDAVGAGAGLVVLSPLLLAISIAVACKMGRPVFFVQERPGRDGRPFRLIKFRSMLDADHRNGIHSDADRLTDFGRTLRSTSLDELPELWNVLRGEMSFVGPRPLLMSYLGRYSPEQARRHEVRPGITGLAQVSGRNAVGWDDRFELDVEYVDRRSLMLDAHILWRTIHSVLRRDGVAAEGHVTMPEFGGSTQTPSGHGG